MTDLPPEAGSRTKPGFRASHEPQETGYAELAAASNFSFLRGASHAEEMVAEAAKLGLSALGLADRNSVAGLVRGHMAAKEAGLQFVPGCRLVFQDSAPDTFVWPMHRKGWGRLCELLSLGKRRAPKGECHIVLDDLLAHSDGLLMAVHPLTGDTEALETCLAALAPHCGKSLYCGLVRAYGPHDQRDMARTAEIAARHDVPLLALGDVLYHHPARRPLQDVLTCIREGETLKSIGARLEANAERRLRSPAEALAAFKGYEAAVCETLRLVRKLDFSLDELAYQYPDAPVFEELGDAAMDAQTALERLTEIGLKRRFPDGAPPKVLDAVAHETALIKKLDYAPYFLTVYDIVRFARSQKILCQGRGSAANSVICYCLSITEVDPSKVNLLFERFISEERGEPPDIDVDFEHERREEVIQYIYRKYGRENAGLAATVITYRARSAIREVGKVFGLSEDSIAAIAGVKWGNWSREIHDEDARRAGLDPTDKHLKQMLDLARQIIGFPRHLSQHVGGFVITRDRLSSLIPIENAAMEDRTIVSWDKDDLESLNMLKIDILALGMLTCIRKSFEFLANHYNRPETLSSLSDGDTATYDMICKADTVGVFQIESRAQMSMLPRLRPRCYYDLVIEVAIVRPGPIQGNMVHPYLRRRQKKENVAYPSKALEEVLKKTLGVPLFQEQAMSIAIVAANFSPGEADKLRRAMATFRRVGTIGSFHTKMVEGMVANGYDRDFADHCFRQIEGFGEYGFPESHAASFALLVYVSCWLKCHYPDVFCAALLNSQPMGFYAPAQLIRDARKHGVEIRPVDVNFSDWDCLLEPDAKIQPISPRFQDMRDEMGNTHAVRLGLRLVKGLGKEDAATLTEKRGQGYDSVRDLWLRSGLSRRAIEKLADADCFRSIGLDRRDALWAVKALDPLSSSERLPLFAAVDQRDLQKEPETHLPPMMLGEHVMIDYQSLAFSLKAHPMSFIRDELRQRGYGDNVGLGMLKSGRTANISGLVLVRQRPGSAKGVIFETLEDETGIANIVVWPKVFEQYRSLVLGARCIGVTGRVQNVDDVVHVVARHIEDLTPMLAVLYDSDRPIDSLARADEVRRPVEDIRRKIKPAARLRQLLREAPETRRSTPSKEEGKVANGPWPKGRNFH
ncbi:error-prone DNA polymerase [Fulvimarina sp. MAC3]|uniref:error-prone DNA polymerase n=1 Tax=Fulvimarina sp. MAC3 TaxID=3148887 RepID=UPI0031FD825E